MTDAEGKELAAAMEVTTTDGLSVYVEDSGAAYPIRVDPMFSDADGVALNSSLPGADSTVQAMVVVDGSGNLYISGDS